MKRLGISIDGVLRDFNAQFEKVYRKKFIYNENIVQMNDDLTLKELSEVDENDIQKRIEEEEKKRIRLPINTGDILNHFSFYDEVTQRIDENGDIVEYNLTPRQSYEKFLNENPFQIFGKATEMINGAVDMANRIQAYGLENNLFQTAIVSKNSGRQISSSLFFLAESGCRVKNLIFVDAEEDKWDYCDIIIDASTQTIQSKPSGKKIIKINNSANQWDNADYSFENIREVYNSISKLII